MANKNLNAAKTAKKDEFYTEMIDIERELQYYWPHFKGKVVFCNCDDPYESNFFKYFALHFNHFGLKKLICTCYNGSPVQGNELMIDFGDFSDEPKKVAFKVVITEVKDLNGDGAVDLSDVRYLLQNDKNVISVLKTGDFRDPECIELLKEADIVVTNPPFSLFREFMAWIMEAGKQFSVIGNKNGISYKEIFPLIKNNVIWLGPSITSGDREFMVPKEYVTHSPSLRIDEQGNKFIRVPGVHWFTNIDHGLRHEPLPLMTMEDNILYSKHKEIKGKGYLHYENYDAIDVPYSDAIPIDYEGIMGVPITFLDKYCPEQFEILGITDRGNEYGIKTKEFTPEDTPIYGDLNRRGAILVDGVLKSTYARLLIRKKQ